MLYFIVHSDTLSVFKKSSDIDSAHLELKVKFHHNLISIDNNSKLLSSVIAQALDELGEKIDLENKEAAIAIDDSILSHSLSNISKKKQSNLSENIKQELKSKWKELFRNYFSISESKKSSKNIFHTAEMNHYLREKIKLNFNNFGIDIRFLVPISSIVLSGIKSTQYAVTKSSRIYSIFNYSKKGFSFHRGSFTGKEKGFKRIIGLGNVIKVKEKDLKTPNLKYIIFNDIKVVEFLAKIIKDSTPILNFVKPFGVQILGDESHSKAKMTLDKSDYSYIFRYLQNGIAGLLTLGLLSLTLVTISDVDFVYNETPLNVQEVPEKKQSIPSISRLDKYRINSYTIIDEFLIIAESDNMSKIQSITMIDNRISIDTKSNDGIGGTYIAKSSKLPFIDQSIPVYDLITLASNLDNANQFKRINGSFLDMASDNLVIRCDSIDISMKILDSVKQYNNLILRKITYTKSDNSVHLYVTVLRS
ncbi:MAG TPA: hypothetical protein QGF75_02020 [Candidatus Marinimicrobia bacterium]|nr:hypothetical protein [Candidatus Neomarinimicrobiota bacterium]